MKAIVRDTYGSTDVLELRDIDKPEIAEGDVLVRVRAAGVDRGVWHVMTGLPYPIRLAGYGLRTPKNPVLVVRLRFDLVQGGSAASDLGDDVLGGGFPDEWFGVGVPVFGPGGDGLAEVGDAGKHAAA